MKNLYSILITVFITCICQIQAEDLIKWSKTTGINVISIEGDQVKNHQLSPKEYDTVAFSSTGRSILAVTWKLGALNFDLYYLESGKWTNQQFSLPYADSRPLSLVLATTERAESYLVICNHDAGYLIWRNRNVEKPIYEGKFDRKLQAGMITLDGSAVTFFEEVKTEAIYQDRAAAVFTKLSAKGIVVSVSQESYRTDRGGAVWPLPAIETSRNTFAFISNYLPKPERSKQIWEWDGNSNSKPTKISNEYNSSITSIPGKNDVLVTKKDGLWVYQIPSEGQWKGTLLIPRKDDWLAPIHHLSPKKELIAFRNGYGIWVGKISDQSLKKIAEPDDYGFAKLHWILSEP